MNEFALIFRGRDESASLEQRQKTTQRWVAWMRELDANGHIKHPGQPLDKEGKVVVGKRKVINDGPYAEAKDLVNGFMLILASDLNQAAELAQGCPILDGGGTVEARPVLIMRA